jgi:hypothetical protein
VLKKSDNSSWEAKMLRSAPTIGIRVITTQDKDADFKTEHRLRQGFIHVISSAQERLV